MTLVLFSFSLLLLSLTKSFSLLVGKVTLGEACPDILK